VWWPNETGLKGRRIAIQDRQTSEPTKIAVQPPGSERQIDHRKQWDHTNPISLAASSLVMPSIPAKYEISALICAWPLQVHPVARIQRQARRRRDG
jgi:hypothetical protein